MGRDRGSERRKEGENVIVLDVLEGGVVSCSFFPQDSQSFCRVHWKKWVGCPW